MAGGNGEANQQTWRTLEKKHLESFIPVVKWWEKDFF